MFSQKMSADLVIENTYHTSFAVLARELDVHFTFSGFLVMGDTRGSNLILLKVDGDPFANSKFLKIVCDVFMCLILI